MINIDTSSVRGGTTSSIVMSWGCHRLILGEMIRCQCRRELNMKRKPPRQAREVGGRGI